MSPRRAKRVGLHGAPLKLDHNETRCNSLVVFRQEWLKRDHVSAPSPVPRSDDELIRAAEVPWEVPSPPPTRRRALWRRGEAPRPRWLLAHNFDDEPKDETDEVEHVLAALGFRVM